VRRTGAPSRGTLDGVNSAPALAARAPLAPLEIGTTPFALGGEGGAEELARQGELAERLGYGSFWLPEHHFGDAGAIPAPLLLLAAVAARTARLRVATTSFLLPVRHPIHVAEEVAVLDRLSGGRVILGVGRGFRGALFTAFDVPAAEKRDRFEANLRAIVAAWRGEPVAFEADGAGGAPKPVLLAPLPVQRPHPPVWVAAFGPKAVAQAGRLGLPYLASPIEPLGRLLENHARHRAALPEAARGAPLAVPVMRTVFASRDPARLREVREALARQAAALARAPSVALRRAADAELGEWAIVGEPAAVADGIARYREELGMTHLVVRAQIPGLPEALAEASLALVAELAGR
jgi:alkanesulfonate monooxygenase SsuD/methylene tetrahydromethanopterin reductase-like flavin-dependent oxidoreductase (luciferase family)